MATNPRCRVCNHPDRAAIENAILAGKAKNTIARTFSLGYVGKKSGKFEPDHKLVTRHVDRCMPDAYQAAMEDSKTAHGAAIATRLRQLDDVVDEVLDDARKGHPVTSEDGTPLLHPDGSPVVRRDHRVVLAAVKEARANAEMLARLSGAAPEEAEDAAKAARAAVQDPEVRRLLTQVEEHLGKERSGR